MKTFTIDNENNISAFGTPEEAAAVTTTPFDSFASQQELAELAAAWPDERLVAIWNSLPGVTPAKKVKDRKTGIERIWKRIQRLGESAEPKADQSGEPKPEPQAEQPEQAAQPQAEQEAKGGAQAATDAPAKAKAKKKAATAKAAPKGKKAAKAQDTAGPREGSKTAQVVAMLQRKNGATLAEIMDKMGWQKHTVRGFMAGAMKKAGYAVESFKPEGGERTYRINK